MRLSTVFELLLIFLFIAFAASRSVDSKHHSHHHHKIGSLRSRQATVTKPASAAPNRYCQCTSDMCNCCRDFSLPVVSLKGPGCANVQYLNGDSMRLTMSFGDRILRNFTLSGKKPRPVCMGLPGAETRFCGRIYGIQRVGDQFKACLALELRSSEDIEAALRVSCFKFGPDGVKLEPGKPVPDTDDYDDDDDYGFDDEDDDDDDDFLAADDEDDDDDEENDVDSGDYTGFSALGDEFLDGFFDSVPTKNKKKKHSTSSGQKPEKATTKKPTVTGTGTIATTAKVETTSNSPVTSSPSISPVQSTVQASTPGKSINTSSETSTESFITSTEYSVQAIQDGITLDGSDGSTQTATTTQEISPSTEAVPVKTLPTDTVNNGEEEEEDEDKEDEEEEEEEAPQPQEAQNGEVEKGDAVNDNKVTPQSKDDDENILDGILGDEDDDDDDDDEGEKDEEKDDDEDEDDDEFRQLRSHVPRSPYQPMTLEDTERRFPGLSALIKPPSVPFMSLQEQERRFPGLAALIRQPNQSPYAESSNAEMAFDFPPVRSARTHRRMRLPPQ